MVGKTAQVAFRLEPEIVQLADEVAELASAVSAMDAPSRAAVLRSALKRGLEEMRAELKAKLAKRR